MRSALTASILLHVVVLLACGAGTASEREGTDRRYPVTKTEEQWRKELGPERYRVLREKGTEPAFANEYWDHKGKGMFLCAACGQELFSSEAKYDSGTGWPSFFQPAAPDAVATELDTSHMMTRTEAVCARCGGHLGHVFPDGPKPTGERYCINSAALRFEPKPGK